MMCEEEEEEEVLATCALNLVMCGGLLAHQRQRPRRYWIRPNLLARKKYGAIDFMKDLILDDEDTLNLEYRSSACMVLKFLSNVNIKIWKNFKHDCEFKNPLLIICRAKNYVYITVDDKYQCGKPLMRPTFADRIFMPQCAEAQPEPRRIDVHIILAICQVARPHFVTFCRAA